MWHRCDKYSDIIDTWPTWPTWPGAFTRLESPQLCTTAAWNTASRGEKQMSNEDRRQENKDHLLHTMEHQKVNTNEQQSKSGSTMFNPKPKGRVGLWSLCLPSWDPESLEIIGSSQNPWKKTTKTILWNTGSIWKHSISNVIKQRLAMTGSIVGQASLVQQMPQLGRWLNSTESMPTSQPEEFTAMVWPCLTNQIGKHVKQ